MREQLAITTVGGSVDGTPVSCAMASGPGTTAGISDVAALAQFRRRGYGAAVTWAVGEGARAGCDHAVPQASELGTLLRTDGFRRRRRVRAARTASRLIARPPS